MLRIDHPCARSRETEPGTDPGFSKRQPRDSLRRRNPTPDLSLDRAGARPAGVPPAEPPGARVVTQLSDEDDGIESGASDPVDRSLSEKRIAAAHTPYRRHRFPQRYTRADVELLATVDAAHENLSGPATRRILEREYRQYGKPEYERLSTISVAHLYN